MNVDLESYQKNSKENQTETCKSHQITLYKSPTSHGAMTYAPPNSNVSAATLAQTLLSPPIKELATTIVLFGYLIIKQASYNRSNPRKTTTTKHFYYEIHFYGVFRTTHHFPHKLSIMDS